MSLFETRDIATTGFAVASSEEKSALEGLVQREREWYAFSRRYETNDAISDGVSRGELVWVGPTSDITPIKRFLNPAMDSKFPSYLLPGSRAAFKAIGRIWRRELIQQDVDNPDYRLAATSFVRSEETQAVIVRNSEKLATPDSTHCVAAAFDIDTSAYYEWGPFFGLRKISHPNRSMQKAAQIGRAIGEEPQTGESTVPYNQAIMDIWKLVRTSLHQDEAINYVPEFVSTPNECSHVAPNPVLDESDWEHM